MAKYSKEIVSRIVQLISSDSYTIEEVCKNAGISKETFYEWKREKPDFADAIKKAQEAFDDILVVEAKRSLMKKVKGYSVTEIKTVYEGEAPLDESKPKRGRPSTKHKVKEQTKTTKHIQPDTASIIFVLTNKVPDEYKNKFNGELTGKNGKDLIPARILSKEERKELLKELENDY